MRKAPGSLPLWRKVAFGAGDFGFNFSWQFTAVFLLYFYTDVLKLAPSVAGAIYMTALIWDAAVDPLIGQMAERTRSRYGRFRPYLIFGAVPLGLAVAALTTLPALTNGHVALVAAATHILFRTAFATVNIPYSSLSARITRNSHERTDLAALRMMFGQVAGMIVALSAHPAVALLGGGDEKAGWAWFGAMLGCLSAIFIWLCAWGTRGLDAPEVGPTVAASGTHVGGSGIVRASRSLANSAFVVVAGSMFVTTFALAFFQKNVIYWFEYGLGDKAASGTALAIPGLVSILCIPIWSILLKRFEKRNMAMFGASVLIAGYLLFLLIARGSVWGAWCAMVVYAMGYSASVVCCWAMLPDTVEYGEWRTGRRNEGLTFGVTMLLQKSAIGFGAGGVGVALGMIGYRPGQAQAGSTLDALLLLMTLIPAAGALVMIGLLSRYPMSHRRHAEITSELAAKAEGAGDPQHLA